jgi:hypothetical protein
MSTPSAPETATQCEEKAKMEPALPTSPLPFPGSKHEPFPLENDYTWVTAVEIAATTITVPPVLQTLVRNSWNGIFSTHDFLHHAGFSGWNSRCLLRAADMQASGEKVTIKEITQAIDRLGVRMSATVAAINFCCYQLLMLQPPQALWTPLFKEMMTEIEVGFQFGAQADGLGGESGMLMGFARCAGLAVLLGKYPREYAEWHASTQGVDTRRSAVTTFGCEPYQVGSALLQQLGFGPEAAMGSAVGVGNLQYDLAANNDKLIRLRAAHHWIRTLLRGASAPNDPQARAAFPNLTPPSETQPVPAQLESLYSLIAIIRRNGSQWLWHLPANSYDDSANLVEGRKKAEPTSYKTKSGLFIDRRDLSQK